MTPKLKKWKKILAFLGIFALNVVNLILWFGIFSVISLTFYTKETWGNVNLPQLLFFVQSFSFQGVEKALIYEILIYCIALPLFAGCLLLYFFKKINKFGLLWCNRGAFFLCLVLFFVVDVCALNLAVHEQGVLYILLFVFYLINQKRSYGRLAVMFTAILSLPVVWMIAYFDDNEQTILSLKNFEYSDFYCKNYQRIDAQNLKNKHPRNVIVVFVESLENRFVAKQNSLKLKDNDALKFANFTEGYAQTWTQGAVFSAFTGTHIHYISDFYRYALFEYLQYNADYDRKLDVANEVGEYFDFKTPNITYLGDVTKAWGYNNLWVQGGDMDFSGTDNFLLNHGFDKKNVFDVHAFYNNSQYKKASGWWGVKDKDTFALFQQKISQLDKNSPFLAVMFTLDLHRGDNPFFYNDEEIIKDTISNLNNFVNWFKKQDFYENTTLIIVADHQRMGTGNPPGGNLYNAFYNLPKDLSKNFNPNRTFNQIDLFPTILEILGFDIPSEKAGMGVSLFSKDKTVAERLNYVQQEKTLTKIDKCYQKLWQKQKNSYPFKLGCFECCKHESLIAHGGGKVRGLDYANSLQALNLSAQRGYKYIELDLWKTHDNRIVAVYDIIRLLSFKKNQVKSLNFSDLNTGDDGILFDEQILDFFLKHPDIYFVTDKIDDFKLLKEKFFPLQNRMIVEVFSTKKFEEAKQNGFKYIAYNICNEDDVCNVNNFDIAIQNHYDIVTISLSNAQIFEDKIQQLRSQGIVVMIYSVSSFKDVVRYQALGDVFYYDGEENLN